MIETLSHGLSTAGSRKNYLGRSKEFLAFSKLTLEVGLGFSFAFCLLSFRLLLSGVVVFDSFVGGVVFAIALSARLFGIAVDSLVVGKIAIIDKVVVVFGLVVAAEDAAYDGRGL